MPVIQTENLCKTYGARRGVQQVKLDVAEGQIYGFLGPNGAGKSTTIRLLLGFLKASSGRATIFGLDCWTQSHAIKQEIGYVAGDVRLYPWLTARKAFQMVGEVRKQDLMAHGLELAEQFRLEPDLPVRKMSRGNRQKVALVLALVHQPKLVVLDEPTSGLDPLMQDTLAGCLKDLANAGHTVFLSSHTLGEVDSLCGRVAIVRDGQIVADEELSTLKQRAPRSVTVDFESEADAIKVSPPDFADSFECSQKRLSFHLLGSAAELTRWAATLPMTDISIGRPNLETLFRQYYQTETGGAAPKQEAVS